MTWSLEDGPWKFTIGKHRNLICEHVLLFVRARACVYCSWVIQVFTPRCRCLGKEYMCTIARIDEWRLTTRSQGLFHKRVGYFFVGVCMFNIFFLVAFQFRAYTASMVFISLFYVCLVIVYQRVRAFRSDIAHNIRIMILGGGPTTVEEELEKTRRRKQADYEKVHGKSSDPEEGGIPEEVLEPTRADKVWKDYPRVDRLNSSAFGYSTSFTYRRMTRSACLS